jgi:riboflavin synthase
LQSRLNGHLVQGHIDTTGKLIKINSTDNIFEIFIQIENKFRENVIHTGSIAINGVSLTIAEIIDEPVFQIKISLIPFTYEHTQFRIINKGDELNIEFDMIGKYIKRIINKNN